MKNIVKLGLTVFGILFITSSTIAQTEKSESDSQLITSDSTEKNISNDFDFVIGNWEMFDTDGNKLGEQVYVKREQGHLITEEWTTVTGGTGLGMTFVDPKTGLWRQVYVSSLGIIDYSGGIDENGSMVLEGTIYPTDGSPSSPVQGIWTKKDDGTMKEEFLILNAKTNTWITFYLGIAHRKN